jgi:hypothetical protein
MLSSFQNDLLLIPSNIPSICIPFVFESINDKRIMGIFQEIDYGIIERIEKNPYKSKDGRNVNRVFIHLNWKFNENVNKVRNDLLCGREIIIMYDSPWFWKISANRLDKIKPSVPIAPLLPSAPLLLPSAPLLLPSAPIAPLLPLLLPSAPLLVSQSLNNIDSSLEKEKENELSDDDSINLYDIRSSKKEENNFNVNEYISKFPSSQQLPKKNKKKSHK